MSVSTKSKGLSADQESVARSQFDEFAQEMFGHVDRTLDQKIAAAIAALPKNGNGLPKLKSDDVAFLIWTCGFAAGAHMDRDGEKGERIFLRCRQIIEQLAQQLPAGANPS